MNRNSVGRSACRAAGRSWRLKRRAFFLSRGALRALTVLLLYLLATGCAAPATPTSATPSPEATLVPSPLATPLPTIAIPSVAITVTLADDGKVVSLKTGDHFLLSLDSYYDWTVTVDNPAIVRRLDGLAGPTGSQGVFQAAALGQTNLSAVGDPPCRQVKPACGAPSRLFRVTVVVR